MPPRDGPASGEYERLGIHPTPDSGERLTDAMPWDEPSGRTGPSLALGSSTPNRFANDWTLGAFCSRYCAAVAQHHNLEDVAVFPHLRRAEPTLEPVIDRLTVEHHAIHDAIGEVDRALVHHINNPGNFSRLQGAIDALTDSLLSHLSYEEHEPVEPLARVGFMPGQV